MAMFNHFGFSQFVQGNGLENIGLRRYYLGRSPQRPTDKELEKVFQELFNDAVGFSTMLLPEPYKAEDFVIRVGKCNNAYTGDKSVRIFLKSKPNHAVHAFDYFAHPDVELNDSENIEHFFACLAVGVNVLLRRVKK